MEIIPKPTQKIPSWQKIIFYSSIVILSGLILGCFILSSSQKKSSAELKNTEESLAAGKTPQRVLLEKDILSWQKKINNLSLLVDNHYLLSRFFAVFEKKCHPRVWFSQFNLDSKGASLVVSGLTDSFSSLGQQLLVFKNEPLINNVVLTAVAINKKGQVEFTLNFSLVPQIFK